MNIQASSPMNSKCLPLKSTTWGSAAPEPVPMVGVEGVEGVEGGVRRPTTGVNSPALAACKPRTKRMATATRCILKCMTGTLYI